MGIRCDGLDGTVFGGRDISKPACDHVLPASWRFPVSFWVNMQASLQSLMTSGIVGWMANIGITIFGAIAIANIAMFGLKVSNGVYGDKWLQPFEDLMIPILFGYIMLNYWSTPIPGVGYTFPHLVTGSTDAIANQINQATVADVITKLGTWQSQMESPTLANIVALVDYAVLLILIWVAQAGGFLMNAFAMVATSVCVIVGPIFVGCMMFPGLEFAFKGWLRSFIQYSFLRVTVSVIIAVMGNFLVNCMTAIPHASVEDIAANMPGIVICLLSFIYAIFKAGDINNSIFSGSSGSSTGFIGAILAKVF
jgi:TrbL/VirB6 plasmid conjugal transfer protein